MVEIVFDEQTIKYVALFQDLTRTTVVDCVDATDKLIFVVKEGDIGKAIGKKGENIAKLKRLMNKDIHVVEYSDQPDRFVARLPELRRERRSDRAARRRRPRDRDR